MADEKTLFDGHPAVLPGLGAWLITILTLGLAALVFLVRSRSIHYRITEKRVVIEHGLLSKRLEQIDVYRIKDYVVERPLGQRIAGTGNIVLHTMDQTTPRLDLKGLPTDVVALYEAIRAAAETERLNRGVRLIDNE